MHKPKDNSRYGDEIRAEERKEERAGRARRARGGRGKKLLFKNVFTVWLARIAIRLESSLFTLLLLLPRVCAYACGMRVYVCESAYRFIRGDVETVEGRRYGGGGGGGEHLPILIYTCAWTRVRVRVRVDVCQRLLRPSVAFPCLNARRLNAKAFQIDVEARRFETETMDKGKTDNPRCNSW